MPIGLLLAAVSAFGLSLLPWGTASGSAPVQTVRVVNSFPHDPSAFCQGLVMHRGMLLEGTGQLGQSRLRLVELESGQPTVDIRLPGDVFGEGVTVWQNTIIQLTWRNGYLITWDAETFQRTGTVSLRSIDPSLSEGWGITHDGRHLIVSDGSAVLRFIDPATFRLLRRVRVRDGRSSVSNLNELEFVHGELLANVWYKDQIARIDPDSGRVTGWLELKHLRPESVRRSREAVLNGIAWDDEHQRLFVTGKNWPVVYEITYPPDTPR